MNSIFLIHLVATIVSCCFMVMMWRYNMKLIKINYDLMKHNLEIERGFNKKIDDLSARMPGTMWMDTKTGKVFVRGLTEKDKNV